MKQVLPTVLLLSWILVAIFIVGNPSSAFACSVVAPAFGPVVDKPAGNQDRPEEPVDCYEQDGFRDETTPRDMAADVLPALAVAGIGMALLTRAVRWSLYG